ncbi:hypothetical protein HZS_5444 [Henneguya salminicola]|nr:hypothetical protein HZS_5444 [Henneguya salminicola]
MNYTYYKCVKSDNYSENRAIANISQFLSGCKMLLLMRDSELFEPADLYDALDLKKVFITLSLISRKDLCKKKKMKHFFCPTNMAPIILGSGEFMSPKIQSLSEQQHSEMSLYEAPNFMQTESLYMDTDNFLNFKSSFTITVEDQQNKYQHALAEFMKTEQNYFFYHLNLIGLIYDYLYERLSFSELEIIFNNFQNLKNAHNIICQSFKKICKEKKDQTVAYAIIKYVKWILTF